MPTKDPPNPMTRPCQYQRATGKSRHEATESEVMSRRWKMIGHILRKDRIDDCNIAISWASEGKKKTKNHLLTYGRERSARGRLEIVGPQQPIERSGKAL